MSTFKPLDENGLLFLWQQILSQFVKQESGKGLSTNDLTNELLEKIQNAGDSSFNGDYNSLINMPQVNGIELKGNKTLEDLGIIKAITDAVGEVTQIAFEPVESFDSLPETGKVGVFYLVPNTKQGNNNYDEYIWNAAGSAYELIGQIQSGIDLSGYVKTTDIVPMTNEEILEIINTATAS